MKFLVRWAFRLFIVLLVLAVGLVLLKDILAKALAEHQIRAQSGMDVKIGKLELGLFAPTLTVEDLKIFNRAEFGGSPLLEVPDLHIEYDLGALARRRLHLKLVRLSLTEVNVVENREGRTNLVLALDSLDIGAALPSAELQYPIGLEFAGIDTLNLTLGRVKYTSLRRPEKATEVNLGLRNEIYTNIKSLTELRNLVMKTLFRNGITITAKAPAERRGPGSKAVGARRP
jgi:uncharacterized protein involved in outer membrane biogenesis